MNITFNLPINSVSFGVTSIAILRELYKNSEDVSGIMNIGDIDMSAQKPDGGFNDYLTNNINKTYTNHKIETPVLKLWHIAQSIESIKSNKNILFTFHETSEITETEKNVLNLQDLILVSSPYTKQVFEAGGVTSKIILCPLGLDNYSIYKKSKKYYNDDRIVWGLNGKMETRKATFKTLNLWAKKYGNSKQHMLHCLVNNSHIDPNIQNQLVNQALEGKKYNNIIFLPRCKTNEEVNDVINAQDINLDGLALCEGFNYGLFNSLCLGKQAIVLNEHVHKLYANYSNSILVNSNKMVDAEDGFFFKKGNIVNTGQWHDWDANDVAAAMDIAVSRAKTINVNGELLTKQFNFTNTVNIIKENL